MAFLHLLDNRGNRVWANMRLFIHFKICLVNKAKESVCPSTVFPTMDGPYASESDRQFLILSLHLSAFLLYPSMEILPS